MTPSALFNGYRWSSPCRKRPPSGGSFFLHTFFQQPRTIGTWKLEVSDRTEFFNNIDPKLTLECALILLAELIHDLAAAHEASGAADLPNRRQLRWRKNMLKAVYGKRFGLALAGILAGAVMGLAFADVARAGRGGGGGFHGGGWR